MKLTPALKHLLRFNKNIAYAELLFKFKEKQHKMAKAYKEAKNDKP